MKNFMKRMDEEGFTLVELMVVVAIIGILSAVAIPNFKKYQAKSKSSEAKLALAAMYTAETALQSDFDNFADCLVFAGYTAPLVAGSYYSTGFAANVAGPTADVVNNGGAGCAAAPGSQLNFAAGKSVGGLTTTVGNLNAAWLVGGTGATFIAGAIGVITTDAPGNTVATADQWIINENKVLGHALTGY